MRRNQTNDANSTLDPTYFSKYLVESFQAGVLEDSLLHVEKASLAYFVCTYSYVVFIPSKKSTTNTRLDIELHWQVVVRRGMKVPPAFQKYTVNSLIFPPHDDAFCTIEVKEI